MDTDRQLIGGHLVGERSPGDNLQILDYGDAVSSQTTDPIVRIHRMESTTCDPSKTTRCSREH